MPTWRSAKARGWTRCSTCTIPAPARASGTSAPRRWQECGSSSKKHTGAGGRASSSPSASAAGKPERPLEAVVEHAQAGGDGSVRAAAVGLLHLGAVTQALDGHGGEIAAAQRRIEGE